VIPRPILVIGLIGLLPFAVLAVLAWIPANPISLPDTFWAALAYGAVVLSFAGGIRLGAARPLDLLSLFPPLAGWVALLIPPLLGLCLLIAGYLLFAFVSVVSVERGALPDWMGKAASLFTAGAVLSLLAMLVKLLT